MNRDEVKSLFRLIKDVYPQFEVSSEKLDTWTFLLKEFDAKTVIDNTRRYVLESKFPPTIADIKGNPKEPNDHLAKIQQQKAESAKVPMEKKRQFRAVFEKLAREKSR